MSDAVESQGTLVRISNEDAATTAYGAASFASLGEVKTFQGPNGSASVIDVSHLQSTRKEKRMGLPDEGQITFTLNRIPSDAGQISARAARAARQLRHIELPTYSDNTVEHGEIYVLEFSSSGGVDQVNEGSITCEITGEWIEV